MTQKQIDRVMSGDVPPEAMHQLPEMQRKARQLARPKRPVGRPRKAQPAQPTFEMVRQPQTIQKEISIGWGLIRFTFNHTYGD